MPGDVLEKFREDFYLLLEAGFLAVNEMDEDSAIKLFKAAQILKPENTFPKVGFGYMHLCKLEIKQAIQLFKEVIEKEPKNDMAKTLLGIAMSMSPKESEQGEKLLTETGAASEDKSVKDLANTALDFVNKFVKKAPSPMDPQKGQSSQKRK